MRRDAAMRLGVVCPGPAGGDGRNVTAVVSVPPGKAWKFRGGCREVSGGRGGCPRNGVRMEIETTRFGRMEVNDERIIVFPRGLLGFPEHRRFALIQTGQEN